MTIGQVIKYLEQWAPPGVAWESDNIGLQVGDPDAELSKILVCLELTEQALDEAIDNGCNLIISHHPFIFRPLKNINTKTSYHGILIKKLLTNDISLFSAHTNLDYTKGGVSFVLAEKLGLTNIDFLNYAEANQVKLVVFIPEKNTEEVAAKLFEAGAGIIGEYSKCSFRTEGTGTFEGSADSEPVIGKKESFEKVNETRAEFIVNKWSLGKVLAALNESHPYEEPAYDIYPVANKNMNYGEGATGFLKDEIEQSEFIEYVSKKLNLNGLRYTTGKNKKIKKVAVCGGSGAGLVNDAIRSGADALITADIKYHTFFDAKGLIMLIDAGHYETEIFITDEIKERLEEYFKQKNEQIEVKNFSGSTNPIMFYNNNRGV